MNLKKNVWILPKMVFKWTWLKCLYSSSSLNTSKINQQLSSFKNLKYPESMFVHNNDIAGKYQHCFNF